MDANSVFKTILQQIEASQLNYSLSKTPFSASISLKSSFIKRFQGDNIKHEVLVDSKTGTTEVEKLRQENYEMKESMKELKERLASQDKAINEHFKEAKVKFKLAEEESAAHREELIQIKKEKTKLGAQVKTLQGENQQLVSEIKFCKDEADESKKSTKKHDEKVKKLEKDKELLKISEDKLQKQILDLKLQLEELEPIAEKTESGNQTENFECNNCAKVVELKVHVPKDPHKSKLSECDSFSDTRNSFKAVYKCFYCDKTIASSEKLKEHRKSCHGTRMPTESIFSSSDPCEKQFKDNLTMDKHMNTFIPFPIQTAESFAEGFRQFCNSEIGKSLAK